MGLYCPVVALAEKKKHTFPAHQGFYKKNLKNEINKQKPCQMQNCYKWLSARVEGAPDWWNCMCVDCKSLLKGNTKVYVGDIGCDNYSAHKGPFFSAQCASLSVSQRSEDENCVFRAMSFAALLSLPFSIRTYESILYNPFCTIALLPSLFSL